MRDALRRSAAEDDTLNAGVESSKGVKFSLKDQLQGAQGRDQMTCGVLAGWQISTDAVGSEAHYKADRKSHARLGETVAMCRFYT